MGLHVGAKIRATLEAAGMSKSEFGRRLGVTSQNTYKIFSREDMDTGLLYRICKVLRHDFFRYYTDELRSEQIVQPEKPVLLVEESGVPLTLAEENRHLKQVVEIQERYIRSLEKMVRM